jgi:hypothetical protein
MKLHLIAVGVFALAVSLVGGALARPSAAVAATYLNETFADHANNWNPATGPWQLENGRYSNCTPTACDGTNPTRSWIGVATDANTYTIETDIHMIGAVEECKVLYTNAHHDEQWRVDLMQSSNQVRLSAPSSANQSTWTPSGSHGPITGGGAVYHLKVVVARNNVSVHYRKGAEPLDLVLSTGTSLFPDGKVGVGSYAGDCDFDNFTVTGEEGIGNGNARLMPVFGYERTEACNEGPANPFKTGERMTETQCDRPLFAPWNRDDQQWWNNGVEEMGHAHVATVAAHNRGCSTTSPSEMHGEGDMCPNQLTKLVDAINTRGSALKIAMFDDFPTVGDEHLRRTGQPFDMGNSSLWADYLWDRRWNRFYATIPSSMRATENGRPLIFMWHPVAHFTNLQGNLSQALDYLRQQTQATYGFDPFIVVTPSFYGADSTLPGHVDAVYEWYDPGTGSGTLPAATLGSYSGATIAPSLRAWPANTGPGCGSSCLEVQRWHGHGMISALEQQKNTDFVLLEGWTNVIESAGWYRSLEGNDPHGCTQAGDQNVVDYANQSLNIVQRYANPGRTYVELEGETADDYFDTDGGNNGGAFRATNPGGSLCTYNDLDIGQDGNTYFDGWIIPGEWIAWRDVYLPAGTYDLTVRYSTPNSDARVCAQANGSGQICTPNLPNTGAWTSWSTSTIGTVPLHKGLSTLRLDFIQAQLNVDKLIVQRIGP